MKFRVLMASVAALLLGVSAQSAAAALGPAEPLSAVDIDATNEVRTHTDALGKATAIWMSQEDALSGIDLLTRTRSSSGGWSGSEEITDNRSVEFFDVAFSANGHSIVAWSESDMSIWSVRRSPSGIWSDPVEVQEGESVSLQRTLQVAVDPQGNGVIAYRDERPDPLDQVAAYSYFSANTGLWTAPDEIDETFGGDGIDVIYDNIGNFVAIWHSLGTPGFIKSSSRPAGDITVWSPPAEVIASSFPSYRPAIAADPAGNVMVVWGQHQSLPDPPYASLQVWYSHRGAGGAFSAPDVLYGSGSNFDDSLTQRPLLFAHADGKMTAGWVHGAGGGKDFLTSTWTTDDVWGGPDPVGSSDFEVESLVGAVDANGLKTFAWRSTETDDDTAIHLRTQDVAGAFGAPEILMQRGTPDESPSFPSVSAAGDGAAAVAWRASETPNSPPVRIWARYSAPVLAATPPPALLPTRPRIGRVTVSPKKLYRTVRVKGSRKKRKTSADVQFSLSEPAMVTLEFQYRTQGRLIGGQCVKKSRKNIRRRSCERVSAWGMPVSAPAGIGASAISFSARKLRKGNYYVIVNATSPTGATATPVREKMTVG